MTLVVGELLTLAGTALIAVIAICLLIARAVKKRKKQNSNRYSKECLLLRS